MFDPLVLRISVGHECSHKDARCNAVFCTGKSQVSLHEQQTDLLIWPITIRMHDIQLSDRSQKKKKKKKNKEKRKKRKKRNDSDILYMHSVE